MTQKPSSFDSAMKPSSATAITCFCALILLSACSTSTPPLASKAQPFIANDLQTQGQALPAVLRPSSDPTAPRVQFGPYSTQQVENSWPRTRTFMVINPTQLAQAQQKFSFTQQGPEKQLADVLAMTTFRNAGFRWVNGALSGEAMQTLVFAGSIHPKIPSNTPAPTFKSLSGILNHGEFSWEFIVYNFDKSTGASVDSGMIQDILGNQVLIRSLRPIDHQEPSSGLLGFEYLQNGHPIGAISITPPHQVWLRSDLSSELKLVLSSLSSALLLRQESQAPKAAR